MKQNKIAKMEVNKRPVSSDDAISLYKPELEKGIKEFEILRKAYELIFEDSQFFYEQLAIAFSSENNKTNA